MFVFVLCVLTLAFAVSSDYGGPCHQACVGQKKGCSGPEPEDCRDCRHLFDTTSGVCVDSCNNLTQWHDGGECKQCDEECVGCVGPYHTGCRSCRHLKRFNGCVSECTSDQYVRERTCVPCHDECHNGCTTEGILGCNPCPKPLFSNDGRNNYYNCFNDDITCFWVKGCIALNDTCPDGYFEERVPSDARKMFRKYSGRLVCSACHRLCSKCDEYGFSPKVCQECSEYKSCTCPPGTYFDADDDGCHQCRPFCHECTGPRMCTNCGGDIIYRVYGTFFPTQNGTFECADECPKFQPFPRFHEVFQNYCSSVNFTEENFLRNPSGVSLKYIYAGGVGFFLVSLASLFIVYIRLNVNKNKIQMKVDRMLEEPEESPVYLNIAPNTNKLRIIRESDITKTAVLGSGAFGVVYRGFLVREGCQAQDPVAVKVFNSENQETSTKELLKEARIMGSINHPNLLPLMAICVTSNVMLVTELMPLGDLHHYLHKHNKEITPKTMLHWCTQIAKGMDYLEKRRLLHRDLAARNVLLQTKTFVKVTDFGLARVINIDKSIYESRGGKLPVKWLALESLEKGIFTHKTDVWALGITVWEILTYGEEPYGNKTLYELRKLLKAGERLRQPDSCSADLYTVLATCWVEEDTFRPSFQELVDTFSAMVQDPQRVIIVSEDNGSRTAPEILPRKYYHEIDHDKVPKGRFVSNSYENIAKE